MAVNIFLLEDDADLAEGLVYSLKKEGYAVTAARTLAEAKDMLCSAAEFSLLILDVSLPDGSGFELCRLARQRGILLPILFLTAADEEFNIVRGLDCGGDDYLTKPFRLGELHSRIRALLRRAGMQGGAGVGCISSGRLHIDLLGSRVTVDGRPVELTAAEYRLLCLLVRNGGRTLTRETILRQLWDDGGSFVDDNTLSVYVRRLREKIEQDPSRPEYLLTVRGFGYRWREAGA